MYYENGTSQNLTLGNLTDSNASSSPVVASEDLAALKTFYIGKMYEDVEGGVSGLQTINGIQAERVDTNDNGNDKYWEYILYNNNIYKVTYNYDSNEGYAKDAIDVSLVEVDLSSFAEREIEPGYKILVTPIR